MQKTQSQREGRVRGKRRAVLSLREGDIGCNGDARPKENLIRGTERRANKRKDPRAGLQEDKQIKGGLSKSPSPSSSVKEGLHQGGEGGSPKESPSTL